MLGRSRSQNVDAGEIAEEDGAVNGQLEPYLPQCCFKTWRNRAIPLGIDEI